MSEFQLEDYDIADVDDCPNCGGDGFVANCMEPFSCLHPDDGCDLCTYRCDWCNHPSQKAQPDVD